MAIGDHLPKYMYHLPDDEKRSLERQFAEPFDEDILYDRDWFGAWTKVDEERVIGGKRVWMRYNSGAMLAVDVDGKGRAHGWKVYVGQDGLDMEIAHAMRFQPDTKAQIAKIPVGQPADAALQAAFGPRLVGLSLLGELPNGDGSRERAYLVSRGALLSVTIAPDGRVRAVQALEHRPAYDRMVRVLTAAGKWPPK